jgi:putative tryptophan/tyrosine transport system substrate-binding protein
MRRREFITLLGGASAAWPIAARAQGPPRKIARIGIIDDSPSWDPFRQQLHELQYVEGQKIPLASGLHCYAKSFPISGD